VRAGRAQSALLVLLTAAACAAAGRASAPPPRQQRTLLSIDFTREVAPFAVTDELGRRYDHPFLGGMDAPRPQFVDIDGDGDLDLFVQLYSNSVMFFENAGTAAEPRMVWRSDRYQELAVGEWYRFVDIDGDDDLDIIAEEPFSYVKLFTNGGSRTDPRFQPSDTLRDADGMAMFVDRQNIPAVLDLDCDGRLDLFVGRVEGTVSRYEAVAPGVPRFELQADFWEGIEIIGQIDTAVTGSRPTTRHGANALAFGDFDGDGDQDLYWGDFFERGVLIIENIGRTCSNPVFSAEPYLLPYADSINTSGYNAPMPVDFDGDGDTDFFIGVLGGAYNPIRTASDNFYHWERVAPDNFELRTRRFLSGIDVGAESRPALADIDGDGDLDLAIGSKLNLQTQDAGEIFLLMNEGSARAPSYRLTDTLGLAATYTHAPAFGDLDGDGDPDMLVGSWSDGVLLFRNERSSAGAVPFVRDSSVTITAARLTNATPALGDLDGDGDLDLVVGEASGEVLYFENTGTSRVPRFELRSAQLGGIDVGRRSAPTLVDIDGDGLLDLVVGREEGGAQSFRNTGTKSSPKFEPYLAFSLSLPPLSSPVFGDVDGDGVLDMMSGTVSGGVIFMRGRGR
jgi:hypothetical protein